MGAMTAVPTSAEPGLAEPDPPRRPVRQLPSPPARRTDAGAHHCRRVRALRGSAVRDWRGLTIRAVAEEAGVNERTVYRHFGNEQGLHDAVMHRLEEEAGIDLEGMRLDDVADVTARIFEHVSSYPTDAPPPLDPTLAEAKRRQHEALLAAVSARARRGPKGTAGWRRRSSTCCGASPGTSAWSSAGSSAVPRRPAA